MNKKTRFKFFTAFFMLIAMSNMAQNPLLPPTAFIADGEPHVFKYNGEERLYIYGSRDERVTAYCGFGHDVWSAPVDDLTKWTNHGEVFNVRQIQDLGYGKIENQTLYAPDCVYNPKTGKFYLYVFLGTPYLLNGKEGPLAGERGTIPGDGEYGPRCAVAESDSPTGPFINPVICDWPGGKGGAFDPSVLVDEQEDGSVRVYAYWGERRGDRWAEIDPEDMHTIIDPKTKKKIIDRRTRITERNAAYKTLNNPALNNYSTLFEASSIKKVAKDKYVFIYSPNDKFPALTYCYSNSPEGPWIYGGVIVDNEKNWDYGNNHGSIVKVKDQWYVVYHRSADNPYNRQMMIEPIDLRVEGDKVIIPEVEMTSQGIYKNGLDAFKRYNAYTFCYKTRALKIAGSQREPDGLNPLVEVRNKACIGIKYLNFGDKRILDKDKLNLRLNASLLSKDASITVQVVQKTDFADESKRVSLGTFKLSEYMSLVNEYQEISLPINNLGKNEALNEVGGLKGQMGVLLFFEGSNNDDELCRIKEYEFAKGKSSTPNPLKNIQVHNNTEHGKASVIPEKTRSGESVKISIQPDSGYQFHSLQIRDKKGNNIIANKNADTLYAPLSFNFEMPESDVDVFIEFKKVNE